jgi:hypothetical protein
MWVQGQTYPKISGTAGLGYRSVGSRFATLHRTSERHALHDLFQLAFLVFALLPEPILYLRHPLFDPLSECLRVDGPAGRRQCCEEGPGWSLALPGRMVRRAGVVEQTDHETLVRFAQKGDARSTTGR